MLGNNLVAGVICSMRDNREITFLDTLDRPPAGPSRLSRKVYFSVKSAL